MVTNARELVLLMHDKHVIIDVMKLRRLQYQHNGHN